MLTPPRGLTLLTLTLTLAAPAFCASCTDLRRNNVHPDEAAKKWANDLKIPIHGVSCTTVDSDDDGYVSCVVSIERGDTSPVYQGLQCGELGSTKAGGCKPDSKNPKVDIVEWRTGAAVCPPPPACPAAPACPECQKNAPTPGATASPGARSTDAPARIGF